MKIVNGNNKLDPKDVVEHLNNFYENSMITGEFNSGDLVSIANRMSAFMLPVPNLFELNYERIDSSRYYHPGQLYRSKKSQKYLIEKTFKIYQLLYFDKRLGREAILNKTYLQLVHNSSDKTFRIFCDTPERTWIEALNSEIRNICDTKSLVRLIRILSVAAHCKRDILKEKIFKDIYHGMEIISILSNIADIDISDYFESHGIAGWISTQVRNLLLKIDFEKIHSAYVYPGAKRYMENYYPLKEEHFNPDLICCLIKHRTSPFCFDNLYKFFTSAKSEKEKFIRMKDFVKGMNLARSKNQSLNDRFIQFSHKLHLKACENFLRLRLHGSEFLKTCLEMSEKNYDFTPYLSKGNKCSSYLKFKAKTSDLMDKYFESSIDKSSDDLKLSYISQEFFAQIVDLNIFMKSLKVLDIIHSVWLMYDDLLEPEVLDPALITDALRPYRSRLTKYLTDFLRIPSLRGRSLSWFQFTLKKCPFLFLSYRHESHLEDVIKMLKGVKISKAAEDSLYFVINSTSHGIRRDVFHHQLNGINAALDYSAEAALRNPVAPVVDDDSDDDDDDD